MEEVTNKVCVVTKEVEEYYGMNIEIEKLFSDIWKARKYVTDKGYEWCEVLGVYKVSSGFTAIDSYRITITEVE